MALSIDRFRKVLVAGAAGGLLISGLVVAPAEAYPPGKRANVQTQKSNFRPGQTVKARANRVKPGCRVQFKVTGPGKTSVKVKRANSAGQAQANFKASKRKGKYRLRITTIRTANCPREVNSTTFRVRGRTGPGRG